VALALPLTTRGRPMEDRNTRNLSLQEDQP
jgi:hypothetical protein